MGCASSKQSRCRHCHSPYSPVPRSYSMHVHHPPQSKGDSYHVVALTSTTLGTLKLDSFHQNQNSHVNGTAVVIEEEEEEEEEADMENKVNGMEKESQNAKSGDEKRKEFSMGIIEAKTWSSMINEKIPKIAPKTPTSTPPGEPETINAWELMEGLEDVSPLLSPNHFRSFSFDVDRRSIPAPFELPKSRFQENGEASPRPMWLHMAESEQNSNSDSKTFVPEFDPAFITMFSKSVQEDDEKVQAGEEMDVKKVNDDYVKAGEEMDVKKVNDDYVKAGEEMDVKKVNDDYVIAVMDHKTPRSTVVVYFTSLRGVRKTYEDCCHVRVILKSLGIRVDERDMSMHSGFKEELKDLLGDGFSAGSLPRVFLGKRYIGGADEIRRLHEEGQLEKLLEGSEKVEGGIGGGGACEACGDIRFVPCETCSGSCKIYYEANEEEKEEEDDEEEGDYGFQRCPDCNENGLIRCPICCY